MFFRENRWNLLDTDYVDLKPRERENLTLFTIISKSLTGTSLLPIPDFALRSLRKCVLTR